MIEGGAARMRRNGARLFKNPPQPHMCIQDSIQGSSDPCYINVLSWGRIAMPHGPSDPVPLYGGMRIFPPRTENAEVAVYNVMANPEILRLNGKNAQDPQERSVLIELLLDFVEAMNGGVVFTRCYNVLKDRDITGELKEVWMAVQAKRDREQAPQQETWIDAQPQPPAPQYPQYQDQQDYSSQPPQYHSSVSYSRVASGDSTIYDNCKRNPNDRRYQPNQEYHGNIPQITPDQYTYGERGRQNVVQNQSQQSCPAYPQYQFQQLPRQLVPQYINSNIHSPVSPNLNPNFSPNMGANINPNVPGHYQQYIALQQQMVGQRQLENVMHAVRETHSDQMHQMQQLVQMAQNQPVPQYEPTPPFGLQTSSQMNVLRLGRPHMGVTQKSNATKRQMNSPAHAKQSNSSTTRQSKDGPENGAKPKSPVKVLQRDSVSPDRQTDIQLPPEKGKATEKFDSGARNIQVTDLDEEEVKREESVVTETKQCSTCIMESVSPTNTSPQKEVDINPCDSLGGAHSQRVIISKRDTRRQILNSSDDITILARNLRLEIDTNPCDSLGGANSERVISKTDMRRQILNSSDDITILERNLPLEGTEDKAPNQNLSSKPVKTKIVVLKRNSSKTIESRDSVEDPKVVKNGITLMKLEGQQIYDLESDRIISREKDTKDVDEQLNQTYAELKKKMCDNRNGFAHKQKTDSPKRSQTVNNVMKNVFKIYPSTSGDETLKRMVNNQMKGNGKITENEEVYQGYTLLTKSETNQEDVMSEIAQISIQDCKDTTTTEVSAVLS